MHLTRLILQQFRSWASLDLRLEAGLTVISGANASGKTNLIEAASMLASLRSPRASREGELIAWSAPPPLFARVEGRAETARGSVAVAIVLAGRAEAGRTESSSPPTSKRIEVNGLPRRASDAIGAIRAVPFSGLDVELLTGEARRRRTYLDLAISQIQHEHTASLSRYRQAVQQRNALLRRIGERRAGPAELTEWDDLLCVEGGRIWQSRAAAAAQIAGCAAIRHEQLLGESSSSEHLTVDYQPGLAERAAALLSDDQSEQVWQARMGEALERARSADLRRCATTVGPHRDDLAISLSGRSAAAYGSRAQQRDAALSLRLAQADMISERSGEAPILLLDDLFSELDSARRDRAAEFLGNAGQVILTTARPETLPPTLPPPTAAWQILHGALSPA